MPAASGFTEQLGLFIESWDNNLFEPYETDAPLLTSAKFVPREQNGSIFHVPVRGTMEAGITTTAAQLTAGDGTLPYVGARAGFIPDWQVEAPQIDLRSRVKYEAIARSMKNINASEGDKKKAVRDATSTVVDGLLGAGIKRCEAWMMHGRRGIGQVANNSSVVAASTTAGNELANPWDNNAAGFIVDVEFTAASWIEGIWYQSEGSSFDFFANTGGLPSGTRLNTTANTVFTGTGVNQNGLVLTVVQPPTIQAGLTNGNARVCRFFHTSGTAGGTGVGIIGGMTFAQLNASAHCCFESGGPASEMTGLNTIAGNAGTLYGLSAVQYSVARGNSDTAAGNIKLPDLVRRLARPINKGAKGKTIRAVVPTELFAQFANDEATLRRYSADTRKAKNGMGALEMFLPHNATLEILGHALQKDGEILAYVPEEVCRVGSQDITLIRRGSNKSDYVLEVAQSPASEMRAFGQFTPFAKTPSHMLWLGGVTY
jgi:hypothetical protein